jgi:hypothetical protein
VRESDDLAIAHADHRRQPRWHGIGAPRRHEWPPGPTPGSADVAWDRTAPLTGAGNDRGTLAGRERHAAHAPIGRPRVALGTVGLALKLGFAALAVATPLFATWAASSLTAYHGGRIWLAALVGVLVFPGLPLLWELASMWRRARNPGARPPILTGFDRFVLRTLVVGLGFAGIVLVRDSSTVFTALSTRGDWMLDGREGPLAERVRGGLLSAARALEWVHEATHENAYAELVDDSATKTTSEVKPVEDDFDAIVRGLRERLPQPSPVGEAAAPREPTKFVGSLQVGRTSRSCIRP